MWTMSVQSIAPGRLPILLTKVEPEDGRLLLATHSVDANRVIMSATDAVPVAVEVSSVPGSPQCSEPAFALQAWVRQTAAGQP